MQHEIAYKGSCPSPCAQGTNQKNLLNEKANSKAGVDKFGEDKVKTEEMKIIPANRFNDYWADRQLIVEDLRKYNKVYNLCSNVNRIIIDGYIYSVMSLLRHAYNGSFQVIKYNIEHYKALLKIYEKHKDRYGLAYPFFPEEYFAGIQNNTVQDIANNFDEPEVSYSPTQHFDKEVRDLACFQQDSGQRTTRRTHSSHSSNADEFMHTFYIRGGMIPLKDIKNNPEWKKEYEADMVIKRVHICKSCKGKAHKGCCSCYSPENRSKITMVMGWSAQ